MRRKKTLAVLVFILAIVMTVSLVGCAAPQPSTSEEPASQAPAATEKPAAPAESEAPAEAPKTWTSDAGTVYNIVPKEDIVIGFNNGSTTVDFLRMVGENLVEVANREDIKIVVTESNFDVEQILPNVDNLIAQGANIIVDFNVNAEVGGNLVDYCAAKGIPVIGIDVVYKAPSGETSWFMGANNKEAGTVAGEGLAAAVKKQWGGEIDKLVLFFNSENGDLVKLRLSEMQTGMVKGGVDVPDDKVEWIEMGGGGSDTTVAANEKFTNWLAANPDLHKVCVGTVNTETGQGVFSAAVTANRWKDCLLATNNNGNQTLAAWETPEAAMWLGGVVYNPGQYGEYIVPLIVKIMAGENPPKETLMVHEFFTIDDIDAVKVEMGVK
jgi:ABC-type sugar transport system substrate-binding protein